MQLLPASFLLTSILGNLGAKQSRNLHSADSGDHPARSISILQTQKQLATAGLKSSCGDSELVCEYSSWLPLGYSCAPKDAGCPVSCSDGEHVCHTPPTCETCGAVNYCSSQPCPVVCGFGQLMCKDVSDTSILCADLEAGCPINCTENAYSCHTAPSCSGCAGVNWCSSSPCPANCPDGKTSCPAVNGSHCVPIDKGCPANCSKQEFSCHSPGRVAGEAAFNWCSSSPCAPICNASEVVCELTNGTDVCVGREQGCPVTCAKHKKLCHSPPTCKNCTGTNWCSSDPCPEICSSHEISCPRADGSNFCVPAADGCPVNCSEKEHKCHWKPHPPATQGLNWCSKQECLYTCKMKELACVEEDGTGFCVPRERGCPIKCKKHEHSCHTPPARHGGSGLNWCSEDPCPANCSHAELACLATDQQAYTCHNRTDGCPANCSQRQHVCHSPPKDACTDCVAVNWCSDETCPDACGADEITCPHHNGSGASCQPLSKGCPVHCKDSQHSCHAPPACEGCLGTNWCSKEPCPLLCSPSEMACVAGDDGSQFCVAVKKGCPVTCRDEEYICHMPPQCADCVGTNWCSENPCATSV